MTLADDSNCPVCGKDCSNPGGLAAHLQFSKDTDHQQYRATHPVAPTTVAPETAPKPVALLPPPSVAPAPPTPTVAPTTEPPPNLREIIEFTFPTPTTIKPLLSEIDAAKQPSGGAVSGAKPPPVVVPLEPILAGATAAALNGMVLNKARDGKLTPELVTTTGFPKSVEACLRLYFPDLPLDHPVTALIASGASLAILVVGLKAPPEDPKKRGPTTTETVAPTTTGAPPPAPTAKQDGTGDAYWDAILRGAQGGPRRGDDD